MSESPHAYAGWWPTKDDPGARELMPTMTYPWETPAKVPHKCPCCDGWGTRKGHRYEVPPGKKNKIRRLTDVPCPSCEGKGVIFT